MFREYREYLYVSCVVKMSKNTFTIDINQNNQNASWSCPIHCQRCEFIRPNGIRCKNRVCFGSPLCWRHNEKKWNVRAKKSNIPNAGKGLFATKRFSAGEWICPMTGENLSMDCVHLRYPGNMTAPYVEVFDSGNGAVDCACSRGIGSLANALFRPNGTVRGLSYHNAKTSYRPVGDGHAGIWLKARTVIQPGSEIYLWYGNGGYTLEDTHNTKLRRRRAGENGPPC